MLAGKKRVIPVRVWKDPVCLSTVSLEVVWTSLPLDCCSESRLIDSLTPFDNACLEKACDSCSCLEGSRLSVHLLTTTVSMHDLPCSFMTFRSEQGYRALV
jgi:hypothetical protein